MDKYHSTNNDQYLLTHNLIGAETFQELKDLEAMAFAARAAEFVKSKHVLTSFTEEDFKGLHQHLFQDVYSFAGEYRDVDLAKGDTQFCKAAFLSSYAKTLFNQLLHEPEWPSLALP
ncbi:Fic family protein [Gracilibacillus phocaeensis]|uniref:Fic family protein n=1 Tax=Gracilibacillus phocaeensis TaxID=2042304 RepID=UPI001032641E|nr:Fic family protein [Gracilibacillus phocaeensis]